MKAFQPAVLLFFYPIRDGSYAQSYPAHGWGNKSLPDFDESWIRSNVKSYWCRSRTLAIQQNKNNAQNVTQYSAKEVRSAISSSQHVRLGKLKVSTLTPIFFYFTCPEVKWRWSFWDLWDNVLETTSFFLPFSNINNKYQIHSVMNIKKCWREEPENLSFICVSSA